MLLAGGATYHALYCSGTKSICTVLLQNAFNCAILLFGQLQSLGRGSEWNPQQTLHTASAWPKLPPGVADLSSAPWWDCR
jgi:hypothetical protein